MMEKPHPRVPDKEGALKKPRVSTNPGNTGEHTQRLLGHLQSTTNNIICFQTLWAPWRV